MIEHLVEVKAKVEAAKRSLVNFKNQVTVKIQEK